MSTSFWIGLALMIGPVILILSLGIGLFGFSPERAQAIRDGEAEQPVVMEEIRRIHIRSPDRFRHDRLDRHPFYVGTAFSALAYAICVFAGAPVTSNIAALDPNTKLTMSACFITGSTLILSGSSMGLRIGRWTIFKGIRDNITSSRLGDDIRLPYTFGCCGLFAISASTGIYAVTSFGSTLGSLGGWLTGMICVVSLLVIAMLLVRFQRYTRARTTLIDEAVGQIVRGDEVD